MKKSFLFTCLVAFFLFSSSLSAFSGEIFFPDAVKTCQKYSMQQDVARFGTSFTLTITLENKASGCVYKEKISQGDDYNLLTCTFPKNTLEFISKSMADYNSEYKSKIAKEKIFEGKMTNNTVIMNKYLSDPKYCKITAERAKKHR